MRLTLTNILATLTLLLFSSVASAVSVGVLYKDTFEMGDSPDYSVNFGAPSIAGPTGPFSSRSAKFQSVQSNGSCCFYDQIRYAIPGPIESVYLSFDLFFTNQVNSSNAFTIFFDAPLVNTLSLTKDGSITQQFQKVGTYQNNTALHFDMYFSIPDDEFTVNLNGNLLATKGVFARSVRNLRSIRFSYGLQSGDGPDSLPSAYLDNVLISTKPPANPVALAGPTWLSPLGLFAVWLSLYRKKK